MSERFTNLIAGEWRDSPQSIANINPSDTNDCIGEFAQASEADLRDALSAAEIAGKQLRGTGLEARQTALQTIGDEMMARSAELGELLAREEGKSRAEGVGEVYRAGQFFTYYAAEVLRQVGSNADSVRPNIEVDVRREPMGTVAVISPWNFPTATASWKIAPALAFGNSVIWKPANQTPASAVALAEIIHRAGLPAGSFQLLMGPGAAVGEGLAGSAKIQAVTFTGSLEVGRKVASAAASQLSKFQLELGSKNAMVVMNDANIDDAVAAAVVGAYSGTGQKCTASSRLIIHSAVADEFCDKLVAELSNLRVGHALEEGTQMGPVVSEQQLRSNLSYMDLAREEGAEVACGGQRLERSTPGWYMSPALLLNTNNSMRINREEIFGPIAAVQTVDSYEEALAITNDTEYGLVGGIFTQSLARATHFRRNAETGCVTVNLPTAGTDYHVPFGGRKNSSSGPREQGQVAVEFYTQMKTAYIKSGEI